jgi:plastocyanin
MRAMTRGTTAAVLVALTGGLVGCGDDGTTSDAAAEDDGGSSETFTVVTEDEDFDPTDISVAAGSEVSITYQNDDDGAVHNLHVKMGDEELKTELTAGPSTEVLTFTAAEAGEYDFVCDAHPTTMQGVLTVE